MEKPTTNLEPGEAVPPFFSSWGTLYLIVIGNLAVWIVLLYLLTQAYSKA